MKRNTPTAMTSLGLVAAAALCLAMMSGCGDPVNRLLADDTKRAQLWEKVARDPALSGEVVDKLLGADSSRTVLIDRLMVSGGARQAVLMRVATDRTMMEGAVNVAVQDTAMRNNLRTLFRGMEMGSTP